MRLVGIGPVLACLLWLAGFEVLPTVHMAFHDDFGAHQHGVEHESLGHRPHEHEHEHEHEHGEAHHAHTLHHHDHGLAHEHGDDDHHDEDSEAPDRHGENSLAHRHLAAEHSLPTIPPVPQALVSRDRVFERAVESLHFDNRQRAERARGPPPPTSAL